MKPEHLTPHYSTKLFKAYYEYILMNYSPSVFKKACEDLSMDQQFLLSDDNWVSNHFTDLFVRKLIDLTEDPKLPFKVGAFTLDPKAINHVEYSLIKILTPAMFFWAMPVQSKKVNRFHSFTSRRVGPGKFHIHVRPISNDEPVCHGFQDHTLGVIHSFEAVHNFSEYSVSVVNENGEGDFTIEAKYKLGFSWTKAIFFLLLGLGCFIPSILRSLVPEASPLTQGSITFSYYAGLIAVYMLVTYIRFIGSNLSYHHQNRLKTQELYEKAMTLDRRYKESTLLRELSYELLGTLEPSQVITFCLDNLENRFGFQSAMVMLLDEHSKYLQTVEVRGFPDMRDNLLKLKFKYPAERANPQLFANLLGSSTTTILDIATFKTTISAENRMLLEKLKIHSMLVAPIESPEAKHGLLVLGRRQGERAFNQDDLHLIENLTRMLALFFENAKSTCQEQTLKGIFQKYVPAVVLDSLGVDEEFQGALEPRNAVVTSMFVDLRGFTTLSESLPPHKVVDMLNIYIDYVTHFIAQVGGIIDNLIGDGIVAFFPELIGGRPGAQLSMECALSILGNVEELHQRFANKGYPRAPLGIGLHTGVATIGSVGCERKLNFTAIGDTVNLASRLQSMIKLYQEKYPSTGGYIILSRESLMRSGIEVSHHSVGPQEVRGRKQSVDICLINGATAAEHCRKQDIDIQNVLAFKKEA